MIATRPFVVLLAATFACALPAPAQTAAPQTPEQERAERHQSLDWTSVAPHLPDPVTGTSAALETAADVLRARRLPEDALDYYRYALARGGNRVRLMNRIGVTELELHQATAARMSFKQVVAASPKDAEGWNNLGAAEYVERNFTSAIYDYRKAVKLSKTNAIFHSNLGTAYFERKDFEGARTQFETAVKLDPQVFQRGGWGGVDAHVMSPEDRGRFCFEMAKLEARQHDDDAVLLWLARATEAGFDIHVEMIGVAEMDPYRKDARVALAIRNGKAMRAGQVASSAPIPALPPETPLM